MCLVSTVLTLPDEVNSLKFPSLYSSLPKSVSCPVHANDNKECLPLVSVSKGCTSLSLVPNDVPMDHKRREEFLHDHRLVGLVVKASASRAEDPGFESRLRRDFFGVESYQ